MYRHPVVRPPSSDEISQISEKWNMKLTDEEVTAVRDKIIEATKSYHRLLEIPEPTLPVKYPRTPGHKPTIEENPLNAWYWKTDIQGACGGKLHGRTVALKDTVALAGVPLMEGSKVMDGFVPDIDATIVTRMLDEGANITGKSVCENLCFCGNSFTPLTGPVLNPANKEYSAGGSSGGSAALVAAGYVDMAIGCDQGGSIRLPSCWCGIVGLKPTHSLVPYTGIKSLNPAVDHTGPMTRNVDDCALLLEVIAGPDGLDHRQMPYMKVPEYSKLIKEPLSDLKVAMLTEGFEGCKDGVDKLVKTVALKLAETGVAKVVEDVSIPMHNRDFLSAMGGSLVFEEVFEVLANGNGFSYGTKGYIWTKQREYAARGMKTRMADASLPVKLLTCFGQYMKDNYDSYFVSKATNINRVLTAAYDQVLKTYDVIVLPTIKFPAPKLPSADVTPKGIIEDAFSMIENTFVFNITGHPVLTINAGFTEAGLPVGVSIVGKHFDETTVLKAAKAIESVVKKN